MTNYERIKNMSVEEMAKEILVVKCLNLLPDTIWCALPLNRFYSNEKEAVEKVKQWLESEVTE